MTPRAKSRRNRVVSVEEVFALDDLAYLNQ
jgi:hypothetical protein